MPIRHSSWQAEPSVVDRSAGASELHASGVKALLLLADAAQVYEGKLSLLGGGWSVTGPAPSPSAVAVKIEVPWSPTVQLHHFELQLFTADGPPLMIAGPDGGLRPVLLEGDFEVGHPPDLRPGTPLDMALAVDVPPLPLPPDSRFTWRLTIDGEDNPDWQASFATRPAPPGTAMQSG